MQDRATQRIEVSGNCPAILVSQAKGQGADLIWGHSLMGSIAQEDASGVLGWPELTDMARIIRYDARGHGRSAVSPDPQDYRWPQLARDMWQVGDYYGVDSAVLGGASCVASTTNGPWTSSTGWSLLPSSRPRAGEPTVPHAT